MSAFKKFNRQDVYVTAYSAKKSWEASGSVLSTYGIQFITGISGSTPNYLSPEDLFSSRYETLTWQSIYHLYYKNFVEESAISGSYEHYLQSSFTTGSRVISDEIAVISIPRNVIGTHIEPGTFKLDIQAEDIDNYVLSGYVVDDYVESTDSVYGSGITIITSGSSIPSISSSYDYIVDEGQYVLETEAAGGEYIDTASIVTYPDYRREIIDDGNGRLFLSGSRLFGSETGKNVGDIIYTHGQAIITDPIVARYYTKYLRPIIYWKSNQPIYTYNYNCKVKDSELIYSLNPSAMSGSDGKIADNISGSYFKPYVTSIGLYNDAQELVAVAKLGQPVPKSKDTDMTFVVTLDM